jgi:hypothetical protein
MTPWRQKMAKAEYALEIFELSPGRDYVQSTITR